MIKFNINEKKQNKIRIRKRKRLEKFTCNEMEKSLGKRV